MSEYAHLTWNQWGISVDNVGWCPGCGELHVGVGFTSVGAQRCRGCWHGLIQLAYSPERIAAFLVGGEDAVRALNGQYLPGDAKYAHQPDWARCGCQTCETRKLVELAP